MPSNRPLLLFAMKLTAAAAVFGCPEATRAAAAHDPLAPTARWTANGRGAAATPPMGWNSWNAFRTSVNEEKVLGAAQALVTTGLAKLGYVYVNLDDGWWLKRRSGDGRLQIRTSIFPSAAMGDTETSFRPFVARLHSMGLKAGIYTDIGKNACSQAFDLNSPNLPEGTAGEREVGLYNHMRQDIPLFLADWGFDYVKVDACGIADFSPASDLVNAHQYRGLPPLMERGQPNRTNSNAVRALYQGVADQLALSRPRGDYVLSIVTWGEADVRSWGKDVANLWRTSGDITPDWSRMLHNFDSVSTRALYAHPHAWNDPDMMFIGTGDFDEHHLREARSHFSLWAIEAAPLLIGYDLRKAPQSLLDIWGNANVVAVDQDPAGNQGVIEYQSNDLQIIVKTMSDPRQKAVVLFNRGMRSVKAVLTADHLKFSRSSPFVLKDLWSGTTLPAFPGEAPFELAPREARMFIATGARELANGIYLSEIPGSVNPAVDGVVHPELDPTIYQMVDPWDSTRSTGSRSSYTGWGGAQADASPYGQALQIAGRKFKTGIGVLSGSRLEVRTGGRYSTFCALVGINDTTTDVRQHVRFLVYGDGKLLAKTPIIGFGADPFSLEANVTGAAIVELVTKNIGAGSEPASVTWGDAALLARDASQPAGRSSGGCPAEDGALSK